MAAAASTAAAALPSPAQLGEAGFDPNDDGSHGDPSATIELLEERLRAWKHACGYLEDYFSEVAKVEKSQAKDQEKILKTLSPTLREAHHFETAIGGVSGLFENIRANTQAQSNMHAETAKNLVGSVLPVLERLHQELKAKSKEVASGAGKGAKAVEAARIETQKHIDALGQSTAHFDSSGGKLSSSNDPYVLQRGTYYRLNKQIIEENNSRQDIVNVQNNFAAFEAHVIATFQTAINLFNEFMIGQADRIKAILSDIKATAAAIPADFEWKGFVKRNAETLVNPNAPARSLDRVRFPNENHRATKALIEGSLERKSRGIGMGFKPGYYAVTPAGFLHQFKDNDNIASDPTPEVSLYLPDCAIGAVDGTRFTIKGKDSSGARLGIKIPVSAEWHFKAHTPADAAKWHEIIASQTHIAPASSSSVPASPVESRNVTPLNTAVAGQQQESLSTPIETTASPVAKTPTASNITTATSPTASATAVEAEKSSATARATSPSSGSSAQGEKHYYIAPAQSELAEREYVGKQ